VLASGSQDGTVLLTDDEQPPRVLPIRGPDVQAVAFTPDATRVITVTTRVMHIYEVATGALLGEMSADAPLLSVRISEDGFTLLAITNGETAPTLWNLKTLNKIAAFDAGGRVLNARFDRGSKRIVIASGEGRASLWDASSGAPIQTFVGSPQALFDAVLDPTGTMVVTSGADGVLRFWDVDSGQQMWTLKAHRSFAASVHYERDRIVSRGWNGDLVVFDVPTHAPEEALIDRVLRCSSKRFDEQKGAVVEQKSCP
jgi:WD40 repeat protein